LKVFNCGPGDGCRRSSRKCEKEEVQNKIKKTERNILHTIKIRKATWNGHILRRNCLLKHVIEGKIELGKDRSGGKTKKDT
jgi:hypothetical protein